MSYRDHSIERETLVTSFASGKGSGELPECLSVLTRPLESH